jgi:putative membrane protein insertion efficiency factor
MGLGDTSAPLRGPGGVCSADGGAAEPAAGAGTLKRAATWLLLAGVRFYQVILSPLMPSACKFYPSCSHYAAEAIARHGAARGARLAAARLWRCRPFTQGGYDPVPEETEDKRGQGRADEVRG